MMPQKHIHALQTVEAHRVFSQCDFEAPLQHRFLGGTLITYSRTSPHKTTTNEDCVAFVSVSESCGVLLIADGLGGHPGGENASALTANILVKNLMACDVDMMREAILNSIDEANHTLLRQGNGSATTLCVLEIQGNIVRPYSIGDSMILIVSQRGRIKFQTIAHSPVGYALEAGVMGEEEAIMHEDRHIVSNVVGCHEMKIDIGPAVTLSSRDRVIISSDGLTDNLLTQEIVDVTRKGALHKAARVLLEKCQENMQTEEGHPDDLSFELFCMS